MCRTRRHSNCAGEHITEISPRFRFKRYIAPTEKPQNACCAAHVVIVIVVECIEADNEVVQQFVVDANCKMQLV